MSSPCTPRRVGYQKLTTPVTVTTIGNILAVNLTELARITLPSFPYPVALRGKGTFQNTAGASNTNLDVYLGIAPAGAVGAAVAAALCVDSEGLINIGGTTSEPPGRRAITSYVLPPDSGGDFILGAWRETGSDAGQLVANSLIPCEFEAWR
jgi:hypothetical protein